MKPKDMWLRGPYAIVAYHLCIFGLALLVFCVGLICFIKYAVCVSNSILNLLAKLATTATAAKCLHLGCSSWHRHLLAPFFCSLAKFNDLGY